MRRAEKDLKKLTPPPGRGRKVYREEAALAASVTQVLNKYDVADLLEVEWTEHRQVRHRYDGPGRPAASQGKREEVVLRYEITQVRRRAEKIAATVERLGWRVQVTNVEEEKLSLLHCVLTYREGWCLERDFHLIKDKPLGISPLYLQTDEQIIGLTRLLTIGLRVLTWMEIRVREELKTKKEKLSGLYVGQPSRQTSQPTALLLLTAVSKLELTLTQVTSASLQGWHFDHLPALVQTILELLGLSCDLYDCLAD